MDIDFVRVVDAPVGRDAEAQVRVHPSGPNFKAAGLQRHGLIDLSLQCVNDARNSKARAGKCRRVNFYLEAHLVRHLHVRGFTNKFQCIIRANI